VLKLETMNIQTTPRSSRLFRLAVFISTLAAVNLTQAATLIGWDVSNATESDSTLSSDITTIDTNISSGILSRGAGAAAPGSPASKSFGASGFSATDLSGALTNGDYLTFSITVNSGFSMSLTSVAMKLFATTNGATGGALFSSVGGFSSTSDAISTFSINGNANNDQSISLSSGSFSNLTGTIEFRLYAFGGSTGSTDKVRIRNLTGDDLVIVGTTAISAVPEPSTFAFLGGLATLGFAVVRRRSRRV
jgi:hypothetical protein